MQPPEASQLPAPVDAPPLQPATAQPVPEGCFPSGGQLLPEPVQLSATSHGPAAPRQTNDAGAKRPRHALLAPSQVSATSHAPVAARHT